MKILITSILAFISTNIDDIFILVLFYSNKKIKEREIIIGQYLGIGALILFSLAGSLAGLVINHRYIGLLGFFPIYLGLRNITSHFSKKDIDTESHITPSKNNILSVAGTTFANGGDNIAIYIPLLVAMRSTEKTVMIFTFLIMTGIWCFIARYFTHHPYTAKQIDKYGHIAVPAVLILLGLYIIYENETVCLLFTFYHLIHDLYTCYLK